MARTSLSRTVVMTICEVMYYDENNVKKEAVLEMFGDYDINAAQNAARRKVGTQRLIVNKIHHKSFYGTMTLEEFANLCTKSNWKEW